jgi:hypothetical protein
MSFWAIGISAVTTAISTGVTIYSQKQQAKAATQTAIYNNQLAENEASNRELEAAEQIKRERVAKRRKLATLRNKLAGNGTLTTAGTPLAILAESNANAETGINDALRAANMDAASYYSAGQMELWSGKQQASAYNTAAIGSAIKGASSIAVSSYKTYQSKPRNPVP